MKSTSPRIPSPASWAAVAVGVGITLISGAAAGFFSQRWGSSQIEVLAVQLPSVPCEFGEWQLAEENELSDLEIEMLECRAYVDRTYRNRRTGQQVSMAILLGPTGPISVHTPEICYSSRAYDFTKARQAVTIAGDVDREHTFWQVRFAAKRPLRPDLSVCYAWTDGGPWRAANSPRFEFATSRALLKLQVASAYTSALDSPDADPCRAFLHDFIESGWTPTGGSTVHPHFDVTDDNTHPSI